MTVDLQRLLFTVMRHESGWAVEHGGTFSDLTLNRDEAVAAASRRARESSGRGVPSQVCMQDEPDFSRRRDMQPSHLTRLAMMLREQNAADPPAAD